MRAACFVGNGRIEVREKPLPVPSPGDVLLRVHSCALCGTDRHAFRAGSSVIPGHEIAGVISAVGPRTDPSLIGTPGVVYSEWRPPLFDTRARDFWATIDAHLAAFVDSVFEGVEPPVSGADGLKALELTYAAIESFEQRASIELRA